MAKVEKTQLDKDMAAALALIHKQFGEDSMLTFDDTTAIKKIDTASTGSLNLDVALGVGGLPMGRINTIYGESSSGKSTIAFLIRLQFCIIYPRPVPTLAFSKILL